MAEARLDVRSWVATRIVVALCAFALLLGVLAAPEVASATPLGDRISSGRRSQSYYESVMLGQDAVIAGIHQQTTETSRALKDARRGITRSKRALRLAIATVSKRAARVAELEGLYAGTPPEGVPAGFADRLRSVRRELARVKARRQNVGKQHRTWVRLRAARQHRLNALKRSRRAAIARREVAEGGLGAYIVQLTSLAQQRAEIQSSVHLGAVGSAFTWPAVGRIAQTYGCTGFYLNPRHGSCRHFHDGLDIVAGYGSRVRAAADGVVAYAGWNPWDEGGRAWIMVVSHPDGYVTRYGHLLPGALARVGQFVRRGEAIGRMGNTGKSLGTHLHFELLQGSTPLNPFGYLPAGMVQVKVKDSKKPGKHSAKRKKGNGKRGKGKSRRGPSAASRRAGDAGEQAPSAAGALGLNVPWSVARQLTGGEQERANVPVTATATEASSADGSSCQLGGDVIGRSSRSADTRADSPAADAEVCLDLVPARSATASDDAGVPLPDRGTSPAPA